MHHEDPHFFQVVAELLVDTIRNAGRPGLLPCAIAVASASALLFGAKQDDAVLYRIRTQHPAVLQALLSFMMQPRSAEERRELRAIPVPCPGECSCARTNYNNNRFIRELHAAHRRPLWLDRTPGISALQTLLIVIIPYLTLFVGYTLQRTGPKILSKLGHRRRHWPRNREDIFPYGVAASMAALCAWVPDTKHDRFPDFNLLPLIFHLYDGMLGQTFSRLFTDMLPLAVIPSLASSLDAWKQLKPRCSTQDRQRVVRLMCYHVEVSLHFLSFADNRQLGAIMRDNMGCLPTLADLCRDAYHTLTAAYESYPGLRTPEHDRYRIAFLEWSTRLCALLNRPTTSASLLPAEALSRVAEVCTPNPVVHVATYAHCLSAPVCANPCCAERRCPTGRALRRCRGCLYVFYCSRVCQRAAWRHAESPHRAVCATLRMSGIPTAVLSADGMRNLRTVQCDLDDLEPAVRHLETVYLERLS